MVSRKTSPAACQARETRHAAGCPGKGEGAARAPRALGRGNQGRGGNSRRLAHCAHAGGYTVQVHELQRVEKSLGFWLGRDAAIVGGGRERAHRPSCAMVSPGPPWVFFLLFPSAGGRELTEEEEEEDYAVIIAAWIKAAECTLIKRGGGAIRRLWEVEGRVIFGLKRTFSSSSSLVEGGENYSADQIVVQEGGGPKSLHLMMTKVRPILTASPRCQHQDFPPP